MLAQHSAQSETAAGSLTAAHLQQDALAQGSSTAGKLRVRQLSERLRREEGRGLLGCSRDGLQARVHDSANET